MGELELAGAEVTVVSAAMERLSSMPDRARSGTNCSELRCPLLRVPVARVGPVIQHYLTGDLP